MPAMLNNFLKELLYAVLIVSLPIIATYLCKIMVLGFDFLKTWTKTKRYTKYISMAEADLAKVVKTTTTTYVEALKKAGKFDKAAQREAYEKTKTAFLEIISKETLEILSEAKGDFSAWLNAAIEDMVDKQKTPLIGEAIIPDVDLEKFCDTLKTGKGCELL